jgi:glycosyltransferase involved in cell wall biosynthesis
LNDAAARTPLEEALLRRVDAVLVPSIWWENSPLVIQEAFAAKRPLIVSNIGGMAEKVKDGVYGYHFRNRNAADLARVMEMAVSAEVYRSFQEQLPKAVVARESGDNHINCYNKVLSYGLQSKVIKE